MNFQKIDNRKPIARAFLTALMSVVCLIALAAVPGPAGVHAAGGAVYLNGTSGDDAKDGTAAESAVRTFARAKELAAADQSIQTIYITGTVPISGEISLKGTKAVIKRDPGFDDYLMRVNGGATATLSDITIDGNGEAATKTMKSLVHAAGTLNIRAGTVLQNNKLTDLDYFRAMGGALNIDGGVVNMTGGTIQNNTANFGGGVFLDHGAVFNMSGGTIQGNKAVDGASGGEGGYAAGGGVTVYNGSTVNLSGGVITNNTSDNLGGGISIGVGVVSQGMDTLNMTGGTITGNSAGSGGGGILVQAGRTNAYGTANISGGRITNNTMNAKGTGNNAFGGGGIYVNGYSSWIAGFHNGVLNLTNGVIKENRASMEGGGYASCPNSETHIYVKNGVALYGNGARSAKEIYILASNAYGAHSGDPEYSIAPSMLGGTPYRWQYENGSEVPLNKLSGQLKAINNEELSLHTAVTADTRAESLAKVVIAGNTSATRGAGIGSNGTVNMGESDETALQVTKRWDDSNGGSRPERIQVELYRTSQGGGKPEYLGYETVRADDNWQLTFAHLPKSDDDGHPYAYSVKERAVEGYAVEAIAGSQKDGYTITNGPSTRVKVTKVWDDSDNRAGGRPADVAVQLYANGESVGAPVKLTAAGGWTHTWTNLAKKANGRAITYTVDETAVPAGYRKVITGNAEKGYRITNTRIPGIPAKPKTPRSSQSARTGDRAPVALYAGVFAAAAAALGIVLGLARKRRNKQ